MNGELIGFTGFAGSGKTTCAKLLEEQGFIRLRFASSLKSMLAAVGFTPEQLDGDAKNTPLPTWCNHTPRYIMQTLGTEWGRKLIGEDLWANLFIAKAKKLLSKGQKVVVDDVRFLNEANAIRELGGTIHRIIRISNFAGCAGDHPTEQEQLFIPVDSYIRNDAGIDELRSQLDRITNKNKEVQNSLWK
jgi:hypothetical protein